MKTPPRCCARLLALLVALHSQTALSHVVAYPGQTFVGPQPVFGGFFSYFHPTRYVPAPAPPFQPSPQLHQYPAYIMQLVPDVKPLQTPHKVVVQKLPPQIESLVQRIQNIYSYYNYENHLNHALRDGNSSYLPETLPELTQRPFSTTDIPTTSGGNTHNPAQGGSNVHGAPTVKPIEGSLSGNSEFSTNTPQNTESSSISYSDGSQTNVNQMTTTTNKPELSVLSNYEVPAVHSQTGDSNSNKDAQHLSGNGPTIIGLTPPSYSSSSGFNQNPSSDESNPANVNPEDTSSPAVAADTNYGAPLNVNSEDDSQNSHRNNFGSQDVNKPESGRQEGSGLREYGSPFAGNVDQGKSLERPQTSRIPPYAIPMGHSYFTGANKQNQWNSYINTNIQGNLRPDVYNAYTNHNRYNSEPNVYSGVRNQHQDKRLNGEEGVHRPDVNSGNDFQMSQSRPSIQNYYMNYFPPRSAVSSDHFSTHIQDKRTYNYDTPSHPFVYPPLIRPF